MKEMPLDNEVADVVVVGAGMAGVMAALAAKTSANRVIIIEPSNVLGGQGTAGGVAGFCGDTLLVNDFFRDLVSRLAEHDLIAPYNPDSDRRDYDLEWCAFFLQEMVVERGVEVLLHSRVVGARESGGRVDELTVSTAGGLMSITPRFVVDCSGLCIVPYLTGFPVLHEGANRQLPMSLYFTMWDTGKKVTPVLPSGCPRWSNDDEIPMTSLHRFPSGKVEVKMKVVGFDAADGRSRSEAEMFARRHMHGLIYYLQTHGYRDIKLDTHVLASVSRGIGIREERRIIGEHLLTEEEARNAVIFPDAVAVNTYHIDYHWPDRMQRAGVKSAGVGCTDMLDPHHLPLRMMIPKGAKNLLVAGRGASGDQMAMSAFRVMAVVAQMGFAAGHAARQCIESGTDLTNIDIKRLQAAIETGGQTLDLSNYGAYWRQEIFSHEHLFDETSPPIGKCHAATLVRLSNGRFLSAWFAGTGEGHADTGIWMAERREKRWQSPRLVAKISQEAHWNPVLFRAPDKSLRLYFKTGASPREWRTWLMCSTDDGATWDEAQALGRSGEPAYGPVKNKPLVLEDGTWLAPNSVETEDGRWDVLVDRSGDEGLTWEHGEQVALDHANFKGAGVIQPSLWESEPGHVHMVMRSTCGYVCRSDSSDGGRTWSPVRVTDLPHGNTGLDVAKLNDGTLALVFNPGRSEVFELQRTPLTIALSHDNGVTWPRRLNLETESGEYSYPAIIPTATGMAIAYTWNRECIAFWHGSTDRVGKNV